MRYETTKIWRNQWAGESRHADPIVDSAVETMKKLERKIERLQSERQLMKISFQKIHNQMQSPASNRRFMQIAGPARECINLSKPFIAKP